MAEAKSVLDSWVRYEAQVKQRQQKELAETLIAKVKKELENPKVLQQILQQSVTDVESMFYPPSLAILGWGWFTDEDCRDHCPKGLSTDVQKNLQPWHITTPFFFPFRSPEI